MLVINEPLRCGRLVGGRGGLSRRGGIGGVGVIGEVGGNWGVGGLLVSAGRLHIRIGRPLRA